MNRLVKSLAAGAMALLPAASFAQQSDATYCAALSDKYQRYTSDNQYRRGMDKNISADVAMSQCANKPTEAIPVLEKALKDARLDLPQR